VVASASEARGRTRLWLAAPVAVSLLAAGLAAVGARRSFELAEVERVLQAHRSWKTLAPVWHPHASDSLYLILLKGWLHVGSSEAAVRAPSIAAVGCSAAVVYALGARLFDRPVGLAAGAAFAASAYTAGAGREAGPLAFAMPAAAVATWLFVVARSSGSRLAWSAYVLVAGASVYIHASCALVLVAHAAMLVFGARPTRRAGISVAAASAIAAPAVVAVLTAHRHLIDPLMQPSLGDVGRAAHDASGRNVLLLGLAVLGAALLVREAAAGDNPSTLALLAAWTGTPLAAVLALSLARPSLDERYLAVSTPALCLFAAVGLVRIPRRELLAAAAVTTLALGSARLVQLDRHATESWRAAISYVTSSKHAGDRIVVAPARALSAFSYYAGPDRGSLSPGGPTSFVVVRAVDEAAAVAAARKAVHAPAYALRGERRFGRHLRVQEWDRTGLP
jgi:mannosyltransferase